MYKALYVFKASLTLLLGLLILNIPAEAAQTKKYSVLVNGEKVGHLEAVIDKNTVTIDYMVRNNGRGPTISERIETDSKGRLLKWMVTGTSTFGSEIDEEYVWADGRARWRSQADEGDVAAVAPGLYIANDASPWGAGLYVSALLKTEDGRAQVLPGGALRIEDYGKAKLGEGRGALPVRIYAISGVDLQPSFVMIDKDGHLAATLGGGVIREGYEDQQENLRELARSLGENRMEKLQSELSHRFDGPVYYHNVRIFDPKSGENSQPATVVVFDGKISSIDYDNAAAPAPKGATVIDGEGGYLVPGLHDMHSHSSSSRGLFLLAAGVTSTRDQGHRPEGMLKLLDRIEKGEVAGPRVVPNGFIEGRSEYSSRTAYIVETLEEGLDAVRWYADHGYFQIKIYNSMKPEFVKPLADEARRLGLGVTGHVPAFMTADDVILAGYDDIAHINQLMLGWLLTDEEDTRTILRLTGMARAADLDLNSQKVRRTLALMKQYNVAQDTTAMILERLMLSRAGEVAEADAPYLDHMPIGYQRYRRRSFVNLDVPGSDERYRKAFDKVVEVLGLLHENGVQLLPGTDDGTGFSVHRELELYVRAGISPAETLKLATLACAEYLRQDQRLGSIEKGKYADFFLIADNPLENISVIRKPRLVSRGDQIYYPSEIYDALAIKPFASPPPVQTVED